MDVSLTPPLTVSVRIVGGSVASGVTAGMVVSALNAAARLLLSDAMGGELTSLIHTTTLAFHWNISEKKWDLVSWSFPEPGPTTIH